MSRDYSSISWEIVLGILVKGVVLESKTSRLKNMKSCSKRNQSENILSLHPLILDRRTKKQKL